MQFPITVHIANQFILLHQLMEFAGVFIAFRYYKWLRRAQGDVLTTNMRLGALVVTIFGAWAGAHLLGTLEDVPKWPELKNMPAYFLGNQTIVGGLLGGWLSVELAKRTIGSRTSTGDLYTFPIILGLMIGRIGCFSAGIYEQTYGLPTHLPWGMDLGDGICRHPVDLYEILFLGLLWGLLSFVKRRVTLRAGELFKLFLGSYLIYRFLVDFIKPGWRYLFGLGSIQLACLCGLVYYACYLLCRNRTTEAANELLY